MPKARCGAPSRGSCRPASRAEVAWFIAARGPPRACRRARRAKATRCWSDRAEQRRGCQRAGGQQVHRRRAEVGEQRRGGLGRRPWRGRGTRMVGDNQSLSSECRRSVVSLRSTALGAAGASQLGLVIVGLRRIRRRAPMAATAASEIRGALAAPSRRIMNDEALRAAGRTFTMLLRPARKPARSTRTRYGPGGNCFSVKFPPLSETANAVVPPSADTTAPSSGFPSSSVTLPSISPVSAEAMVVTGRILNPCASA